MAILAAQSLSAADRPNLIVIMVDDMGFSDIGPCGSEIPTPHLDALASNGVRFSPFCNTGRCCPTRASLVTGLYSHQVGIGWMTTDEKLPGYAGRLIDHCVTIRISILPGAEAIFGPSRESVSLMKRSQTRSTGHEEGGMGVVRLEKGTHGAARPGR